MKPIVGANNRATLIEIPLAVDSEGDYAFDEDGKPIKGKNPVVVTVPRWDCMSRDQAKAVNRAIAAVDDMKSDDGDPLSMHERGIETVLAMLRQFVSDDVLNVVAGRPLFELEQIAERIQQGSSITVGELMASTSS